MQTLIVPFSRILICKKITEKINIYKFAENKITPIVDIFTCHNKKTIKLKFKIHEPIIEVQNFHPNFASEINKDSSISVILQPYIRDPRNMILRINAAGAYFISFGQWYWNRADCTFEENNFIKISNRYKKLIKSNSEYWEISVRIHLPMLFEFLNLTKWQYSPGKIIYGNFLKVKKTPVEDSHFGMWNEVECNTFDCYKSNNLGIFILE